MKVKHLKGNIIDHAENGLFDVIVHGCNCFHTMGSGIAGALNQYTAGELLKVDMENSEYGDINKLGTYTVLKDFQFLGNKVDIYNLYSQYDFGRPKPAVHVYWQGVYGGLFNIIKSNKGRRIAIPLIGCGLANGKKQDLLDCIEAINNWNCEDNTQLYIVEL